MKISCIIPLYNAGKYINKALDSVMQQSHQVDEIIVVDDCSKDNSVKIVEGYINKHSKVSLIKQPFNQGASSARNQGIAAASGDWILFLDADDLCEPNIIEQYVKYIKTTDVQMIYSQFMQIDENERPISQPMTGKNLEDIEGFCNMLLRNPIISPSGVMVKKEVLLQLNNFDRSIKYVEDVDLWLRLLLNNKNIAYLDVPGSLIRRHAANTTNSIEITNVGERTLLDKFGLELIKEKFYARDKEINEIHTDFINILIRFKKFEEAINLVNEINMNKTDQAYNSFVFTKAILNIYLKDYETAQLLFEEILQSDENNGAVLNNLGVIAAKKGLIKAAQLYFEKAVVLYPNYLDSKNNMLALSNEEMEYKFTYRELRNNLLSYS